MDEDMRQEYYTYEDAGFRSQAQQDFWYKSIPVLIIGFLIWGFTSFVFSEFGMIMDMGIFILLMFLDISTWIAVGVLAYYRKNFYSMITFFVSTFFMGLYTAPLFGFLISLVGMADTARLFLISTTIAASTLTGCYLVGWWARKKSVEKIPWAILITGGLILLGILLPVVFVISGGFNLFYLIFSCMMIGWMYGCGIWYGMLLEDEIREDYWMFFVLGYFGQLINIIIRLMVIFAYRK